MSARILCCVLLQYCTIGSEFLVIEELLLFLCLIHVCLWCLGDFFFNWNVALAPFPAESAFEVAAKMGAESLLQEEFYFLPKALRTELSNSLTRIIKSFTLS